MQSQREIIFIINCEVRPKICRFNWQNFTLRTVSFLFSTLVLKLNTEAKDFFLKDFCSVNDVAQMQFVFPGCNQLAKAWNHVKEPHSCQMPIGFLSVSICVSICFYLCFYLFLFVFLSVSICVSICFYLCFYLFLFVFLSTINLQKLELLSKDRAVAKLNWRTFTITPSLKGKKCSHM